MCNGLFKMKWHLPRLYRKLSVAHFRTKLSLSRVAQRVSLGYRFLLIQAIGCSLPSLACSNTTSSPVPEASTWTLNSFPKLGLTSTGSLTKPFAGCLKPPPPPTPYFISQFKVAYFTRLCETCKMSCSGW